MSAGPAAVVCARTVLSRADGRLIDVRVGDTYLSVIFDGACDAPDTVDIAGELLPSPAPPGVCALAATVMTNLWRKRVIWKAHRGHIETWQEIQGHGPVDRLRFFETCEASSYRAPHAQTKHFNDRANTPYRHLSVASRVTFSEVFCPEPNAYARQRVAPSERAQVSVNSNLALNGGSFVANPGIACFAVNTGDAWLAIGLACPLDELTFSEFEYHGGASFGLSLSYYGNRHVDGYWRTPSLLMIDGPTPEQAVEAYVALLERRGQHPRRQRTRVPWWSGAIACGWGHQCYQADLFRVRSPPQRPPDNAAYTLCTQAGYEDLVRRLLARGVDFRTLIVDARWTQAGALKTVDQGRWPDMRRFIDELHAIGKRVLLWWGPWDVDGLDPDCCVQIDAAEATRNEHGRLGAFAKVRNGDLVAPDISLSLVADAIVAQLRHVLGDAPGQLNADGLKIDHVAATPGLYGLRFPPGSACLTGVAALRHYHQLLDATAREVREDALLIGQSPSPWFGDLLDMIRLGDIYSARDDSIVDEMAFRAWAARTALPDALIDTDGWPMPSIQALDEWIDTAPTLGVPSLYYATHLDTTSQPIPDSTLERLHRAWSTYHGNRE